MEIKLIDKWTILIKGKKESVLVDPVLDKLLNKDGSRIILYTIDGFTHNDFSGDKVVIRGAGEYEVGGVEILGLQNDKSEAVYVVQIDGIKIVILGRLSQVLPDKKIKRIDSVDVLITPVSFGDEMSFKTVNIWAKEWGVNYLLPISGGDKEALDKFLDAADEEGLEAIDSLKVEREELPDGLEVKLLKSL